MATTAVKAPEETLALTRSQLMIWTGQNLQPSDLLYNMVLTFRIRGSLDEACFCAAFRALVENADALRTTFSSSAGVPRQHIHESFDYEMDVVELAESELQTWVREHAERAFDLSRCLFESTLLKLAEDHYVWFFNQHHLTTDAWSTSLIFGYMGEYYRLAEQGRLREATVPPAYTDYVRYEQEQLESKAMKRAKEYWDARLSAPQPPSEFFRSTPAERSGRTKRIHCRIGAQRCQAVREAVESGTFPALTKNIAGFQVFATVLFAWLFRITGNRLLTIGMPNHNRSTSRFKKTIGLFVEIYPLRIEIDEAETFASLFAKVSRATTELLMHAPSGASGFEHHRAYDIVLNYITAAFGDFNGMPVRSEWVHANFGDRNHLVRVQIEDFDIQDEYRLFFDLNADTFGGGDLEKPGPEFVRLLDAMLKDPDRQISVVDILEESEQRRLSSSFCSTRPGAAPGRSVIRMFFDKAAELPNAPAIAEDKETLTYAELARAIEGFAAILQEAGATSGDRIAIAMPRSGDAVVAMLAVLRLGASYVPIDVNYPSLRVNSMLEDAQVRCVVSSRDIELSLPGDVLRVVFDTAGASNVELLDPNDIDKADAAYIIFTSGSTGRPKGVEVTHQSLANYIDWAARYYLDGMALDWPLFSSLSFDLTVTSIFVPLVSGGRIVVYPDSPGQREIAIHRVVEDNQVEIVKLTPAHLALMQALDLSTSRIRKLIVGGENLKTELARSIERYFGGEVEIYNEYGPTEGTVACMVHRFDSRRDTDTSVPIGRSVDNAFVYILNDCHLLQPEGVVGELYVGGAGVARGYVNRPDLTSQRFVPNPFRAGENMYRTGDLARSNPDGSVTCLGRADEQFKLNGIRVEPGEIEAAMLEHPLISECAVRMMARSPLAGAGTDTYCVRCGLSGMHPDARLDGESVCDICRVYEQDAERAKAYFRTLDDLREIVDDAKAASTGKQDCVMLLSGGKDSTYALCQLVDLGLTPLVFTLDNGYISEAAKSNIRRVVNELGLELIEASTPAMNEIFVDSLHRFSNVCNGCFKTIYTLSMRVARERGIKYIFTGLSRGQIFETRVADLFRQRIFDPATIDRTIIEARKAYHRAHDAVSANLNTSHLDDAAIFDEIRFIDYYRYTDVSLDEMLAYLREKVPWVRPADTGRSTNCLINEAGIYVHKKERLFHNYSLPYSWDVRLGHKERDAAREELNDDIDEDNVLRILREIGYTPRESGDESAIQQVLTGYYVADAAIDDDELETLLAAKLPGDFVPSKFVRLEALPLTLNGKLDRSALPEPHPARPECIKDYVAPGSRVEQTLAKIWADVLGVDRVGVSDNFFELGGDSIMNIQIVAAAGKNGLRLSPQQIFDNPTVRDLALVVGTADEIASQQGPVTGAVPLTPIQRRFFQQGIEHPQRYCQYVLLRFAAVPDMLAVQEAVRQITVHHDALRARFIADAHGWRQEFAEPGEIDLPVDTRSISGAHELQKLLPELVTNLQRDMTLSGRALMRVVVLNCVDSSDCYLLLLAHHLIVDAVSWWIIVEDLEQAYRSLSSGNPVRFGAKTTSVLHWSRALSSFAQSESAMKTLSLWAPRQSDTASNLPTDEDSTGENDLQDAETIERRLNEATTRALFTDAAFNWRLQPQELLLTAFATTIAEWSGLTDLVIDMESHGRELISAELDLLRTVGWFTSVYPVQLSLAGIHDDGEAIRMVKRQLRQIPNGGVAFGVLKYLSKSSEIRSVLEKSPPAELLFNYLGQWRRSASPESLLIFDRPVMASYGSTGQRKYIFEVNAAVFDGELQVAWTFGKHIHRRETVLFLAARFEQRIRELTAYCMSVADERPTAIDFPAAELSDAEMDDILTEFGEN